jgi:23S rRNA (guanosine2251-2'-O)-methyltransferase
MLNRFMTKRKRRRPRSLTLDKPENPSGTRNSEIRAATRRDSGMPKASRGTPRSEWRETSSRHSPPGAPWIYGFHAVLAAIANPIRRCHRLVLTTHARDALGPRLAEAIAAADGRRPPPEIAAREDIERLLPAGAVHQGIALLADPLPAVALEDIVERAQVLTQATLVILDQATDPHNVGAVLRSAAAFGGNAVIVPDRHAPDATGALAKAASGALETVSLVRVTNLARAMGLLKESGFWCVGLDPGAERTLAEARLSGKVALVLGAEGEGMRRLTRESCDLLVRIPIAAGIGSLNVSNAAAIALYELARRGG